MEVRSINLQLTHMFELQISRPCSVFLCISFSLPRETVAFQNLGSLLSKRAWPGINGFTRL